MKKSIKTLFGALCLALCAVSFAPKSALAHGEKALEPFIRMRTIQWYDVAWSKSKLNVNEEVAITGKFHVSEDWPRGVAKPDATYLNVSAPGPVLIRTERYLNGQSTVSSAALRPGGDYDFKIVMKARMPGRFHLHPFFNLHDAGAVVGPGQWLEVDGDAAAFTNQVKTLDGSVIDMETYGLVNGVGWHAFWIALGSAWLLWWVRRPLFIPRYKMLHSGQEASLISPLDRKVGAAIIIGVPLIVLAASIMTDRQYPNAIPLQAAMDQIDPLPSMIDTGIVQVKVQRADYNVPARAMIMTTRIHNASDHPVQVGEFAVANVRFLNPAVVKPPRGEGAALTASEGLTLDSVEPIAPGETRTLHITASDSLWQRERLDGLIRDADTRMGGLLFLYGDAGNRYVSSISTAVIPKFN
ncbi:methane/ammonia monooxygenase subunit B [freshwater sediment metagenome]|uniref:Methane/ammonia monooxygenase subunit B n=1 Tax=freshwater sediment metagenome TaxID=556182 RepID=A0AA48M1U4_9ZZZZ